MGATGVLWREETPHHRGWWAWLRLVLLGLMLVSVTGLVIAHPTLLAGRVALEVGDVAAEDIRAPRSLVYESALKTAELRAQASAAVEPIYTLPDQAIARQQLDRARQVLDYLGSVRADPLATPARKRGWILAVPELADLPAEILDLMLTLSDASWNRVNFETLAVVDQAMRREIREGYLEEAWSEVPSLVSLDLSEEEAAVTVALVQRFLLPNSFLDPVATAEARQRASQEVRPVLRTFEAGEILVREGKRVDPLDVEALDQFGLRQPRVEWKNWLAGLLFAAVETSLLYLYLARFQPDVLWEGERCLLLALLTSLSVLLAGLMVAEGEVLRYLAPAPTLAMVMSTALGPHAGLATALFLGITGGVAANYSWELMAYMTLGGVMAVLTLQQTEHIGAFFRAGAFAALIHLVLILTFSLSRGTIRFRELLIAMLSGVANGGISASLALGSLFLIGPLFDLSTTMRLVELSRPDHPLLQRLLREAPATYHHSLMVASLAEQAAERIGANVMLTRVGAYYHDIGKLTRPYFFIENQLDGSNPHDQLDPHTSAEILIAHVKDGMELARKYRLPRRVRDFIAEHHGTSQVSFMYNKAVQLAGNPVQVNPDDFRHRGPKPRGKETALVMLADACEAAIRAARPTSAEEITKLVNAIIDRRVAEGELSECDMTLRDLEIVRESFASSLRGIFHPRLQYPQQGSTAEIGERDAQTGLNTSDRDSDR
ncbi:MAG: HDIG domain-containing protein [Anaerolineae bacterium]|nr:HDIG domain-containing protein [Anaerolineae bacterium]